jgi:hypothetical protein
MTMRGVRDEMDVDTLRAGTIVMNALASPVPSVSVPSVLGLDRADVTVWPSDRRRADG